jgi:hypothetical protein
MRCFDEGMNESGKGRAGGSAQGIGDPVFDAQAGAAWRPELVHFVERAVERERPDGEPADFFPRPPVREPQGRNEGQCAAKEGGEVEALVPHGGEKRQILGQIGVALR